MKILCIGCFHGKIPRGFRSYIRKNSIDSVFALGDYRGELYRNDFIHSLYRIFEKKPHFTEWKEPKLFFNKITYSIIKAIDDYNEKRILKCIDSLGIPVYVIYGNHDEKSKIRKLAKNHNNLKFMEYSSLEKDKTNFIFFGMKYTTVEKDMKKSTKNKRSKAAKIQTSNLNALMKKDMYNIIVSHNPPKGTKLDRVNDRTNPGYGNHYGDGNLAKIIKRKNPFMTIHAHFHENQGYDRIGKSKLVCTGYGHNSEAAVLDIKDGKKPKIKLIEM